MDVTSLLSDYEKDRTKRPRPWEAHGQTVRGASGPVYISALRAGAGLRSMVTSNLDYGRSAGDIPLAEHRQFPLFQALLGNTSRPDDPLSLLDVRGHDTAKSFHSARRAALKTQADVLGALERHTQMDSRLREMTSPESWEGRAAGLAAEIRAEQAGQMNNKPAVNAWFLAFNFMHGLRDYPSYNDVVSNFGIDAGDLYDVASATASALDERSSAFFFSTAKTSSPKDIGNVRKALRYIGWNITYNGFRLGGLPWYDAKATLGFPFEASAVPLTTSAGPRQNSDEKTFLPAVDGDVFLSVLKATSSTAGWNKTTDPAVLQGLHLAYQNQMITAIQNRAAQGATSDAQEPMDALDIRAEALLKHPEKPQSIVVSLDDATRSAHPYALILQRWFTDTYEPMRTQYANDALDLTDMIKKTLDDEPPAEAMWTRPQELLHVDDIHVSKYKDLPFRPAAAAAMDRVASLVTDSISRTRPGSYTRNFLMQSTPRIVEKFAYATARQMDVTAATAPSSRPTSIMRIGGMTDLAAAIAEVCLAILEN